MKNTYNFTSFTVRKALYYKTIIIINDFVGQKTELTLTKEYSCTESVQILRCHLLYLTIYLKEIWIRKFEFVPKTQFLYDHQLLKTRAFKSKDPKVVGFY